MRIFGHDITIRKSLKDEIKKNPEQKEVYYVYSPHAIESVLGRFSPYYSRNYYTLFQTISEIQFPIGFISERAKNAKFLLKKWSDDSVVWDNQQINKFLENPNPFYSFGDFLAFYIQMKLITGHANIYAGVNPEMTKSIWKYCDNYHILPSHATKIVYNKNDKLNIDNLRESIKHIETFVGNISYRLDPRNVLTSYDRFDLGKFQPFSRLESQKYTIANLMAVYEARNVIYTKRGALGAIVGKVGDADGLVPLNEKQKKELQDDFMKYGLDQSKHTHIISGVPFEYVKFGATISELEPFKETLNDAMQIAGIFGIDKDLVPREKDSTYVNKDNAEISVYNNVIIPTVETFLNEINNFLGLNDSGFYIDASWENVAILQKHKEIKQRQKKAISERCLLEFKAGLICLNDWRAELDLEAIDNPLYDKTILQMNENEILEIERILQ